MTTIDDRLIWRITGARRQSSQEEFYKHLDVSDHLRGVLYWPTSLNQREGNARTRIENKKFERVSFAKTKISNIIFRNCIFEYCLFIGASISDCEFHSCRFIMSNTHKVEITNTYIDPLSFECCLPENKDQNIGVHLYQVLLKNSRNTDQIEFERDAQFLFLRWKRYQIGYEIFDLLKNKKPKHFPRVTITKSAEYIRRWIWEKLFGSGIRIRRFVYSMFCTILLLSLLNYIFRHEFGLMHDGTLISSFADSIYFTTISLTTLGYGDITPTTTMGRIVAAFQSAVGFCLFAILASMLFRRVSP